MDERRAPVVVMALACAEIWRDQQDLFLTFMMERFCPAIDEYEDSRTESEADRDGSPTPANVTERDAQGHVARAMTREEALDRAYEEQDEQRAAIVVAALACAETWRKRPALFPTFMEGFCQVVDAYIAIDAKIDALDEGNQPPAN